ncbi:MAG: hypothetical protein HC884_15700 [Chloroflexaceae bacterium]|nr:hypothetical protein [Chloroflexaceae bacterium]
MPTINQVWVLAALILVAMRPLMTPIPPHDFWWHMAMGREMVQTHTIPTTDHFSYTQAGESFYNQSWLAQVLMYSLYRLGGLPLILLIQAGVMVLAYGLLLWLCIRRSRALRLSVSVLLLLIMPISFDNWNVRPQSYAFLLFAAFLVILTAWRDGSDGGRNGQAEEGPPQAQETGPEGKRHRSHRSHHSHRSWLWLLPLLMVGWVNLHGSFVLGGALIAMTFVGEGARRFAEVYRSFLRARPAPGALQPKPPEHQRPPLRRLFLWGAVTAGAMFINPRGFGVLGYVRDLLSTSAVTDLVTEWSPPTIRETSGALFFLFLIFCGLVLAYTRHHPHPVEVLTAVALLWLALGASRNIVWFAMAAMPLLVGQLADWLPRHSVSRSAPRPDGMVLVNRLLAGVLLLLLLLSLPWVKPHLGLPPDVGRLLSPETPVEAVEVLREDPQPPRHLFHAMSYGSYLIWAAPDQPVFADPRIELYPLAQWHDYLNLNAGHQVPQLLDRYQIDGLLLDRKEQAGMLHLVHHDPAWELRYEDARTSYLVRRSEMGGE